MRPPKVDYVGLNRMIQSGQLEKKYWGTIQGGGMKEQGSAMPTRKERPALTLQELAPHGRKDTAVSSQHMSLISNSSTLSCETSTHAKCSHFHCLVRWPQLLLSQKLADKSKSVSVCTIYQKGLEIEILSSNEHSLRTRILVSRYHPLIKEISLEKQVIPGLV